MIIFKKQLGFTLPLVLLIVAVLIVGVVIGYYAYKTSQELEEISKETEVAKPEQIIDETADWKVYQNEEYSFEMKYPKEDQISFYKDTASFGYKVETMPFSCFGHFWIRAWNNPSQLSVRTFVFEKYGLFITSEQFIEDFIINRIKGIKIIEELRLPPGGGAMKNAIFLPKNSKVYEIAYSPDYELMGVGPEDVVKCVEELDKIFNQMLSTFKFIEK